jgi:hypothetical protein
MALCAACFCHPKAAYQDVSAVLLAAHVVDLAVVLQIGKQGPIPARTLQEVARLESHFFPFFHYPHNHKRSVGRWKSPSFDRGSEISRTAIGSGCVSRTAIGSDIVFAYLEPAGIGDEVGVMRGREEAHLLTTIHT